MGLDREDVLYWHFGIRDVAYMNKKEVATLAKEKCLEHRASHRMPPLAGDENCFEQSCSLSCPFVSKDEKRLIAELGYFDPDPDVESETADDRQDEIYYQTVSADALERHVKDVLDNDRRAQ